MAIAVIAETEPKTGDRRRQEEEYLSRDELLLVFVRSKVA